MRCEEIRVRGRVQRVFYRAFTQKTAQALGITGWVKNAPDGSVVIHACGDEDALLAFHQKLKQGPPAAEVEALETQAIPQVIYEDFNITYE